MGRINIPGVIDLLRIEDPKQIAALAVDARLDRRYANRSALFNSFLIGRVRSVLQSAGKPFPTVAPRGDTDRAQAQAALRERLAPMAAEAAKGGPELEPLAAYVRGAAPADQAGILMQQAVGRLFTPAFQATPETWAAAKVMDQAPRSFNPVLQIWWAVTGQVASSRKLLADAVGGDLSGQHAVGVAVHNLVKGLQTMRSLYANASERPRLSPEAAAAQCLVAPPHVLRQPVQAGESDAGSFGLGTLVMLDLDAARARGPDHNIVFMQQSWSFCPAHAWVPALLEGIWRRATAAPEGASS